MSTGATLKSYEKYTCRVVPALTLIDLFAQLRGTQGAFPPVAGPVRFSVISKIVPAGPFAFEPPLFVSGETNTSGFQLLSNEVRRGGSPPLTLEPGRYRMRVESDFYQTAEVEFNWLPDPAGLPVLKLLPSAPYPFPDLTLQHNGLGLTLVRGSVFRTDGVPVAGVVVSIVAPANNWPFNRCVTGPSGDWVLVIPDRRTFLNLPVPGPAVVPILLTIEFALPDGRIVDVPDIRVALGAENSVPQTALRGRVVTTAGVPIPSAKITVAGQPGESISRADGQCFFYFDFLQPDGQFQVKATAPNGRSTEQLADVRRRATVIMPAFRIPMN